MNFKDKVLSNTLPSQLPQNTLWIYPDAGCAGGNPSPRGGAYAFRFIKHVQGMREIDEQRFGPVDDEGDVCVGESNDIFYPSDVHTPTITNNQGEVAALMKGLYWALTMKHNAPDAVVLCPDSLFALKVCLQHCRPSTSLFVMMPELNDLWRTLKTTKIMIFAELIAGHPERDIVIDGIKHKKSGSRYRVSRHNAECDAICTELCAAIPIPVEGETYLHERELPLFRSATTVERPVVPAVVEPEVKKPVVMQTSLTFF